MAMREFNKDGKFRVQVSWPTIRLWPRFGIHLETCLVASRVDFGFRVLGFGIAVSWVTLADWYKLR